MVEEKENERFSKNAPGPFYVVNGECITCMAPEYEAPDLMGFDEEVNHCFFKKQPSSPEELDRAARAVWASCCGAVKYGGNDPKIKRKIAELYIEAQERIWERGKGSRPWWKFW